MTFGLQALSRDLYRKSVDEKVTFSTMLEMEMAKDAPDDKPESLDAFEYLLMKAGIRTKSVYDKGIVASEVGAFYRSDPGSATSLLFPEYVSRTLRTAFNSYAPLSELIGVHTPVQSDVVRSYYLDTPDAKKTRKRRVAEQTALPVAEIKPRTQVVSFYKYGRALKASYEALRRMQVDMLGRHIELIGMQAAEDKVEEIINVLVNGDGNSNAATLYKMKADLDSDATAGTLSPRALVKFILKGKPFPFTTLVATEDAALEILLSNLPTLTIGDVLRIMSGQRSYSFNTPQMGNTNFTLIWHDDISGVFEGKKVIALNKEHSIEELTEIGSDIMEADKFIMEQSQVLTISENSGYSKMFKEASAILDIAQ